MLDPDHTQPPPASTAYHCGEVDAATSLRRQAALEELRTLYARTLPVEPPPRLQSASIRLVAPKKPGGLANLRAHIRELDRQSRLDVDEVTLAKQRLLHGDEPQAESIRPGSPFSHFREDPRFAVIHRHPVRVVVTAIILSLLIYKIPVTRTAFKVGMIFALRSAIARLVSRYF